MAERAFPSALEPVAALVFGTIGFGAMLLGANEGRRKSIDACQDDPSDLFDAPYDPVECSKQLGNSDPDYIQAIIWGVAIVAVVWIGGEILNWLLMRNRPTRVHRPMDPYEEAAGRLQPPGRGVEPGPSGRNGQGVVGGERSLTDSQRWGPGWRAELGALDEVEGQPLHPPITRASSAPADEDEQDDRDRYLDY